MLVIFVWLLMWAARAMTAIAAGRAKSLDFVYLVFFSFCGLPLGLDTVGISPRFDFEWGFRVSQFDIATNWIYLLYLAVIPLLMRVPAYFFHNAPVYANSSHKVPMSAALRLTAWLVAATMLLLVLTAPRPLTYVSYGAALGLREGATLARHHVISAFALMTIVTGMLIIHDQATTAPARLISWAFVLLGVWVHGKRTALVMAVLIWLHLAWLHGRLRGAKFWLAGLVVPLVISLYSQAYQHYVRNVGPGGATIELRRDAAYTAYRVDYARDTVIRQAIFAELYPARLTILPERGHSFLFSALFFVPRSVWPEKPQPYAVYATAAMLHSKNQTDIGWGITTSILDESIANLGWLGLLFGPMFLGLVCAVGDRKYNPLRRLLTVATGSLFVVLHMAAFLPIVLAWVLTIVASSRPPVARATDGSVAWAGMPANRRKRLLVGGASHDFHLQR